jgi:hypothetical protein
MYPWEPRGTPRVQPARRPTRALRTVCRSTRGRCAGTCRLHRQATRVPDRLSPQQRLPGGAHAASRGAQGPRRRRGILARCRRSTQEPDYHGRSGRARLGLTQLSGRSIALIAPQAVVTRLRQDSRTALEIQGASEDAREHPPPGFPRVARRRCSLPLPASDERPRGQA